MPQLSLKIPVFRRWGKKFFVCVDSNFFASLPAMETIGTFANSEITWLVYPFAKQGHAHKMGTAITHFSTWADVETALREGEPPDPAEILDEISGKMNAGGLRVHTT